MNDIRLEAVTDRAGVEAFVRVPWTVFRGNPTWTPPLLMERREAIDRRKNPYFQHAEAEFWVAYRDGKPVGRISAQVDRAHLAQHHDQTGHFGYIDGIDDPAVFAALLGAAETWVRARGMTRIAGPFSLSTNEETGLLVDGFDRPPSMLMEHAWPYYGQRVEEQGYAKLKDVVCFDYEVVPELPAASRALLDRRLSKMQGYSMRSLHMRHYDREIRVVMDIFNDAWSGNWGFVPFTEDDIEHTAKSLKPLIVPDMVAIAEMNGEPAAMAICVPNLNEAVADLDGRLLPFGWAKLLWRLKVRGLRSGRVPLMGVRQRYRNGPAGTALALAVIDRMREGAWRYGLREAELGWVLEENVSVRRLIESVGGRTYKTYRVYSKALA